MVRILRALLVFAFATNMPTLAIEKGRRRLISADVAAVDLGVGAWDAAQADCGVLKSGPKGAFFAPLWQGGENPFANHWLDIKPQLATDLVNWAFWIQFYDDALVGRDQNWPLLHEVATRDAIDWDAPAGEINAAIEDILEINALKLSPFVEQMKRDPDDQKIYGERLIGLTAQQTSDASRRVRDAIAR